MSKSTKLGIFLLCIFVFSPLLTNFSMITTPTNVSDFNDTPLTIKTWGSDFRDWSCISNPPPYPLMANNDTSWMARIAVDSRDYLHVVWSEDSDNQTWGTDTEIVYTYFDSISWSSPIAVSDFGTPTDGTSIQPSIAIDSQDNVHVVWADSTAAPTVPENPEGVTEILYRMLDTTTGAWSPIQCISDNASMWNDGSAVIPFIAIDTNDDLHVVWSDIVQAPSVLWSSGEPEILYTSRISGVWSTVVPVSDNNSNYNSFGSEFPAIATDSSNNAHIVWEDWYPGSDKEIFYRNVTSGMGFGVPIMLSGAGVNAWNNDESRFPIIAVDPLTDALHVVWQDDTNGSWGTDVEIFYSNSTNGAVWTNATALSGIGINAWNNDDSYGPWITVDKLSRIHVVWHDDTDSSGEWGTDREIFYSNSTNGATWFNGTCISDDPSWSLMPNTGTVWESEEPCIAYDNTNFVHVVWWDDCMGPWSPPLNDVDVFYTSNYKTVGTSVLQPISPNPSTDGYFTLTWTPAAHTAYYKIYRSTSNLTISGLTGLTPIATTTSTTYQDYQGTNGTYYYVIVAHNVGGDGLASNCESVIVSKAPMPWWIWLLVGLIIVVILLLAIYYRRKKKK
jgi:hypothetical protein